MEIILLKDVKHVGDQFDIVGVKNGYGRNYLIPQGFAIIANSSNLKRVDEMKRRKDASENKKIDLYKEYAAKLEGFVLKVGAKAGTTGKIFGSVTNVQLAAALKDQMDMDVDRKKITILEEIKNLGVYKADINLHKEVLINLDFEVFQD